MYIGIKLGFRGGGGGVSAVAQAHGNVEVVHSFPVTSIVMLEPSLSNVSLIFFHRRSAAGQEMSFMMFMQSIISLYRPALFLPCMISVRIHR